MNSSTLPPVIVPPGTARVVSAFGDEATYLITGEQSDNTFSLFHVITPPGGGPPPHVHHDEDECFTVLEGQAEFFLDGQWKSVPTGSTVFAPRGVPHTFRNAGTTPLKQAILTRPSGFERFFERCSEEFHKAGGPDMARIMEISAEHGIHYL